MTSTPSRIFVTDKMVAAAAEAYLAVCSKFGFRNPVTEIEFMALRAALTAALEARTS